MDTINIIFISLISCILITYIVNRVCSCVEHVAISKAVASMKIDPDTAKKVLNSMKKD